ncbi:AAA family ATPase [Marinomonas sp. 2405UD66-6]|uniref:AAA family ATPase n=1 Tax=Marinomonas sp. 2405UD66-6 TaxID=3391834 RepID=UPI0039C8EB9F
MFDLVDSLKKVKKADPISAEKISTVLFFQTEKCKELVQEAYRFEGIAPPSIAKNTEDDIVDHVRSSDIEVVIVELNNSKDVSKDAEYISHLLPNNASVIVVGSEDAISTIRNLKTMGFYYLFWPITKQELVDFVRSVSDNRKRNSSRGPGQNRRGKYISIIGTKGGVGATFICAEMAYQLSADKKSSCLVVDQNHFTGNLDIMMGIKGFERRKLQQAEATSSLDETFSQGLVYRQNSLLSLLSLSSEHLDSAALLDYTNLVVDLLAVDVNFVIEDCSASVGFSISSDNFIAQCDSVVLVIEPSVSSLRDAARMREVIQRVNNNNALRIILVLNHTVPKKAATVKRHEVETFLKQKVDIEIPYCEMLSATILDNKRIAKTSLKASKPLKELTSIILGETTVKPKRSLFSLSS